MIDYNKLLNMREYMDKLSNGIDPLTGIKFSQDTILNNLKIKKCFEDVSELIESVLDRGGDIFSNIPKKKYEFEISDEQKMKIVISKEPIAISTFVYLINDAVEHQYIKKLRATQITTWLMNNGYLTEIEHEDGKKFKIVTEKAKTIGITAEPQENSYGRRYDINMYNETAQKFILDNLHHMLQ